MANRNRSQPRDAARNGEPEAAAADPIQMDVKGDGRDQTTGRFKPGWRGGKGNPVHRRMAELRKAALEAVTAEDIQAIFRHLVIRANKHCDTAAAMIVLRYVIGKPPEITDPEAEPDEPAEEQDQELLAGSRP